MGQRVIYMGTPDFAVPALERLVASDVCDLVMVVTQPDRRAGRGKQRVSPPIKTAADALRAPVLQTASLRDPAVRQEIIDLQPDLVVVAAFGMILGRWILELPAHGCVNLHASLLPSYRGANPIASAIAEGDGITGITLMGMDRGLDTGPIYATRSVPISDDDTTESLTPKLALAAADVLDEHLRDLLSGALIPTPQGPGATSTRMMTKADGWLDFTRPAIDLERHVRAMWPWPRAWTTAPDGTRIQIHEADVGTTNTNMPGEITHQAKDVHVSTGDGSLILRRVQLPGGKPIKGMAIAQSSVFTEGTVFGTVDAPENMPPLVRPVEEVP